VASRVGRKPLIKPGEHRKKLPSGGTKRERQSNLIILLDQKRKRAFRNDLYYAAKYVFHYDRMKPWPHGMICDFIQENTWSDLMLLLPRGTFKSTLLTVVWTMWMLEKDPNYRFMISSAEKANSKGWLAEIRLHLEANPTFRELFGDWTPRTAKIREQTWQATAIRIEPCSRHTGTSSIVATSSGASLVSQHYDFGHFDDLMNEKTSRSRDMINQQHEYLQLSVPLLDPQTDGRHKAKHGPRKIAGTRWGHDDVYSREIANDKKLKAQGKAETWKKLIRSYKTKTTGKLFFPGVITDAFVQRLIDSKTMTRYQVSCQYENDPQPEDEQLFKLRNMGFYNMNGRTLTNMEMSAFASERRSMPPPNLEELYRLATCDPAGTDTDDSDYTGIVVTGLDERRWRFVLDVVHGRWRQPGKIIEKLLTTHIKWTPNWWGVENQGFQAFIQYGLEEAFRANGILLNVHPLKHGNVKKKIRIQAAEPFISDGKTFFPLPNNINVEDFVKPSPKWGWVYDRETLFALCIEEVATFIDELLRFPFAPTDDLADAFAYQVRRFHSAPKPKKETQGPKYMSWEWFRAQSRKSTVSA
jgi:phage terminase large subunit-like protein